ncbi:2-C-methyl-D-erythritol 4-phosphate cytidylyltransferase [Candidatus Contubernalis alkaliaceticus]|uniref:2-C-methyl-D-erythritol 4-phosphate cytidylyltransferase n=1 Tax=Candidatus Contubernalis alkaliaceticus TaxID=338645 RepID=UPI001F4C2636|nr:2-C-methyl-D-erythritol 4-phosphate cytidylyltransferase [Candidatus Contubernalis alkalaceticus]
MLVSAVVAAAGKGKRMGEKVNKQYLLCGGKPVLAQTLLKISQYPFDKIVVAVAPGEEDFCQNKIIDPLQLDIPMTVIPGGKERQETVNKALKTLAPQTEVVLIHDGARPFITQELLKESVDTARSYGACVVAVPVKDTIKRTDEEGFVVDTPARSLLWAAQTPQAFLFPLICEAYGKALEEGFLGTDDASLVERLGHRVRIVQGRYENIKITTPQDLMLAEALLREEGVGKKPW